MENKLSLIVYSFFPKGATIRRRWALAIGDKPTDVLSTHATREIAARVGDRLMKSDPEMFLDIVIDVR